MSQGSKYTHQVRRHTGLRCKTFGLMPENQPKLANAVITIAIRLRYDYDPTTTYRARLLPFDAIRREQKMNMSISRCSRVVVESQL